ncbi:hypothetical protein HPB51_011679 [Rhipicephalus microplus]|uniref:Uncharacterized protein n=1 Tax=Rhipicephalus microplus TaxID=6941 RepID=A0A9J6DM28_RHIMP|nr:hypothetical protein HPB51_011679 [Rhipicephalus microplus]
MCDTSYCRRRGGPLEIVLAPIASLRFGDALPSGDCYATLDGRRPIASLVGDGLCDDAAQRLWMKTATGYAFHFRFRHYSASFPRSREIAQCCVHTQTGIRAISSTPSAAGVRAQDSNGGALHRDVAGLLFVRLAPLNQQPRLSCGGWVTPEEYVSGCGIMAGLAGMGALRGRIPRLRRASSLYQVLFRVDRRRDVIHGGGSRHSSSRGAGASVACG